MVITTKNKDIITANFLFPSLFLSFVFHILLFLAFPLLFSLSKTFLSPSLDLFFFFFSSLNKNSIFLLIIYTEIEVITIEKS